jgi:RNA polymerase sigma-70 factor, ECF subfamily
MDAAPTGVSHDKTHGAGPRGSATLDGMSTGPLSTRLIASCRPELAQALAETPDLERRLQDLIAARAFEVGDDALFGWLADVLPADDALGALTEILAADAWLAVASARGDRAALLRLEPAIALAAASAAARARLGDGEADELAQRIREKLLVAPGGGSPKILQYAGRAPLGAWVRVVAVREALTMRRRAEPTSAGDPLDLLVDAGAVDADPALDVLRSRHAGEFKEAFQRALLSLSAEERNVLRLYLLDGLSIDEIGALFQVHRATAARWIARSRETIAERTREDLLRRLRMSEADVDSLIGLLLSRIDVSLGRLLRETPDDRDAP